MFSVVFPDKCEVIRAVSLVSFNPDKCEVIRAVCLVAFNPKSVR